MTDEHPVTSEQTPDAPSFTHPRKVLPLFCERFPAAFPSPPAPPVPLKRGIRQDLEDALQGVLDVADVRRTIKFWVHSLAYRQVIAAGGQRVDLQGQPVEEVSEAHRAHAAQEIEKIQAKMTAAQEARRAALKAGKGKAREKPADGNPTRPDQPQAYPAPPEPASPSPEPAAVRLSSGTRATVMVTRRPTLKLKKGSAS